LVKNGLRPMAIDREALFVSSELKHAHGDPFDRLLFAQARVAGMRLLNIDRSLGEFGATLKMQEDAPATRVRKAAATRRKAS
jgi:PIN domain nuclease of toxin-antitoxin system